MIRVNPISSYCNRTLRQAQGKLLFESYRPSGIVIPYLLLGELVAEELYLVKLPVHKRNIQIRFAPDDKVYRIGDRVNVGNGAGHRAAPVKAIYVNIEIGVIVIDQGNVVPGACGNRRVGK